MKHYTAEEWADLARGTVEDADKSRMSNHLESCRTCARQFAMWGRVAAVARREREIEIPDGTVRQAKAMFANSELKLKGKAKPGLAQLLFDSMQVPAPVGVRSNSPRSRQLLFAAGDHRIDVRLEPQPGSDRVAITGQILDARSAEVAQRKIPVSVHIGKRIAGTVETNELGEFQLEIDLPCKVELRAILPDGREISVDLVEPAVPTLEGASYLLDRKRESGSKLREAKKSTRKRV